MLSVSGAIPDDVLARIEAAAADVVELYQLVTRLELTAEEREEIIGVIAAAFDYHENETAGSGGEYFGPMYELGGRHYPALPNEVPPEVAEVWAAAADQLVAPIARARLNDLCFVGGWGNRGARARAAFDARLEAADALAERASGGDRPVVEFARLRHLGRALSLSRHVSDAGRAEQAVDAIVAAIDKSFAQTEAEPGTSLHRERIANRLDQSESEEEGLVRLVHLEAAVRASRSVTSRSCWRTPAKTVSLRAHARAREGITPTGRASGTCDLTSV